MGLYKNNTMEWLKMKDRVFQYLKEDWLIEFYPNLIKLESDLHILTVRDKSIFYGVLAYLEEYKIILIHECENGIERIILHPRFKLKKLTSNVFGDRIE